MKIYTQEHGYAGSIVVIAKDEKSGRKLMQEAPNYSIEEPIQAHEIKEGFVFYNLGDF